MLLPLNEPLIEPPLAVKLTFCRVPLNVPDASLIVPPVAFTLAEASAFNAPPAAKLMLLRVLPILLALVAIALTLAVCPESM